MFDFSKIAQVGELLENGVNLVIAKLERIIELLETIASSNEKIVEYIRLHSDLETKIIDHLEIKDK